MPTTRVRDADLDATFRCPEGAGPFVGVLALGGSEGGIPEYFLQLLVAEGFACLGVAYVNTPDTQPALMEVPLERVERGVRWLRDQGVATHGGRVPVIGGSKGGELALLAASTYPDLIGPVVAYTPSHVVWAGIDFRNPRAPLRSSWSVAGRPLPFVPYPPGVGPAMTERGMSMLPMYDRGLDDVAATDAAAIPIERATGPVMLVSGGDDRMWPAARMCGLAVERMRRSGRGASIRHVNVPDAGHVLFPFEASAPMMFDLGGSPGAGARAHALVWPDVVRLLAHGE